MPVYFFQWTPETEEHIAEHGVTREEVEAIIQDPHSTGVSRTSGRPMAYGWIDDRHIACVYEKLDSATILPITAFEVE